MLTLKKRHDEKKQIYRESDYEGSQGKRTRKEHRGDLQRVGDSPGNILQLAQEIQWNVKD